MKLLKLGIFSALTVLSTSVMAKTVCTNQQGSLVVEDIATRVYTAQVTVTNQNGEEKFFWGNYVYSEGIFSKKQITLFSEPRTAAKGTLEILEQPFSCGRGSCDIDHGTLLKAKLTLSDSVTYYNCHEELN